MEVTLSPKGWIILARRVNTKTYPRGFPEVGFDQVGILETYPRSIFPQHYLSIYIYHTTKSHFLQIKSTCIWRFSIQVFNFTKFMHLRRMLTFLGLIWDHYIFNLFFKFRPGGSAEPPLKKLHVSPIQHLSRSPLIWFNWILSKPMCKRE